MLEGFGDLKPKQIIGFDGRGRALVDMGDGRPCLPFKLFMTANGHIAAQPDPPDNSVDQVNNQPQAERVPVAERWRGVDQS